MKRAIQFKKDLTETHTVKDLTEVFESIASIKIARIRNRVIASKAFFSELWQIYGGLRVNPKERLARDSKIKKQKSVFVAVTAEGKLSGDIDELIIDKMLKERESPEATDVIIIGNHGATLLEHHGVRAVAAFSSPENDTNFNVSDVIDQLSEYKQISVFYQTYESLRVQKAARIDLISAVRGLSEKVEEGTEIVSSQDYIFEPNIDEIADYMESVMMGVALIQVIMESKLAQEAARFNAMNAAKHTAGELVSDIKRQYYRAKRGEADERLKEIMKVVKYQQGSVGA